MTENRPRRSRAWFPPLALGGLVLLCLGGALQGGFVWDDAPLIVENPQVRDASRIPEILTSGFWQTTGQHDRFRAFFRPAVTLSYALDHAVWGMRPFGFHLTNLLLLWCCCWLIYRIACNEGIRPPAALAGAALFAVHPAHVESVAWISGRTDLLCGLFLLGSFLLYRRAGRGRVSLGALALFALALFAKEMAATLPLLVFADRWLEGAGRRRRMREALTPMLPFLATLGVCLVLRSLALGSESEPLYTLTPLAWIGTGLFVTARYLTLLLVPAGLDAHYPYAPLAGLLSAVVAVAAGMLALVAAAGRWLRRASDRAAFWLAWIFVSLLPVLAFGRFGDVLLADRFLFIPSVGLALLAARGMQGLGKFSTAPLRRAAVAAFAIVVLALGVTAHRRTAVWRDDLTLFSDMLRTSPDSALVRNNLGRAYYERGRLADALSQFEQAVALSPGYSLAQNNLAAALDQAGVPERALRHYREAWRLAPGLLEAGTNGGHLLVRVGRVDEGLELLRETVKLHPASPLPAYALADALDRAGRTNETLPLLARILREHPRHAEAHYLLGKIRFERAEYAEAAAAMRGFLELWPRNDAHAEAARQVLAEAEASAL